MTDGGDQAEALKELVAKISFLRIMAPRLPQDRSITAAKFIFRDGEVVEGEAETPGLRWVLACADGCTSDGWPGLGVLANYSNPHWTPWTAPSCRVASSQCSMPEFRQKHAELLKRQYFGQEPPPYDPSTF